MIKSTIKPNKGINIDLYKKGDLLINSDRDMIYMLVATCGPVPPHLPSQYRCKAVCVWSDEYKNKSKRSINEHVADIGEYREDFLINVKWTHFYGEVTLTQGN